MWTFLLTVSLLCWGSEATVSCKNHLDHDVDWYIIYKAPRLKDRTGLKYLYMDSTGMTKTPPLIQTYPNIKDPNGVLANTLKPIFKPIRSMTPNFGFISYSDQPPGSKVDIDVFGHSKGVLMIDKNSHGVWLLHSTPQFPFRRDANDFWPKTGDRFAQTFICVTFNYQQFRDIGTHLQYISAFPFEYDLPADFHQTLKDAVDWKELEPANNFHPMSSSGAHRFQIIAKQQDEEVKFGDLYVTIAQGLNSDVDVQTWCEKSPSFCETGIPKVLNIQTVNTGNHLGGWPTTVDHSKWCVAKDPKIHWTCFADVNRANVQYLRRGGTLCIQSKEVQNIFLGFAKVTEDCPKPKNIKNIEDIEDIIELMNRVGIVDRVGNVDNIDRVGNKSIGGIVDSMGNMSIGDNVDRVGSEDNVDRVGNMSIGGIVDRVGNVDNVDRVGSVDNVDRVGSVDNVDGAGNVDNVDRVGSVDNVDRVGNMSIGGIVDRVGNVDNVDRVGSVDNVDRVGNMSIGGIVDRVGNVDNVDRVGNVDNVDRVGSVDSVGNMSIVDNMSIVGNVSIMDSKPDPKTQPKTVPLGLG